MISTAQEISVVLQGPVGPLTSQALASVRRVLPGAEVILSTWEGTDVDNLDADVKILSRDPGGHPTNYIHDAKRLNNENRLLISSAAGLKASTRKYSVKMRTDTVLTHSGFLEFFDRYPARLDEWRCFKERLVASTVYTRNPRRRFPYPFHVGDIFFFGLTEDLVTLWDAPLEPSEHYTWFASHPRPPGELAEECDQRYAPEQYLWITMLRKFGTVDCCDHQHDLNERSGKLTELTFVNNLILCEPNQLGYEWPGRVVVEHDWISIYGHAEWKALYTRLCLRRFAWVGWDMDTVRKLATLYNPLKDTRKMARVQHFGNVIGVWCSRIFVRAPKKLLRMFSRRP